MLKSLLLGGALAVGLAQAAAAATVWDLAGNFGAPVFQYGSGVAGVSFTPGTLTTCANGLQATNCSGLPTVLLNPAPTPFVSSTVTVPGGGLYTHPSNGTTSGIIRFVAPSDGSYTVNFAVSRLDVTPHAGNGVVGAVHRVVGAAWTPLGSVTVGSDAGYDVAVALQPFTLNLSQGQALDFSVSNNGFDAYDGSGVSGSISLAAAGPAPIPEPGTWALMIGGFGLVGAALRRRSLAFA